MQMSSEMFFAFPHHLSQIIEEEERQSSRTSVSVDKESDELVEEISHQEEAGVGDEDSEDKENPTNSNDNCPTKEKDIDQKEKDVVEETDDGNNNTEIKEEEIKEASDEDSDETVKNKRKISRM